jgi:hypothetical protein
MPPVDEVRISVEYGEMHKVTTTENSKDKANE